MIRFLGSPLAFAIALLAALMLGGCGGSAPSARPEAPVAAAPALDEAALRARLAQHPYDAPALSRLSKILWDGGRHEEAIALLEDARANAASFPGELLAALALHHDAAGHAGTADSLAASLRDDVDWSRAGSALTFLRLRGDSFADSEAAARRALKANPNAANRNNLGIALLYAGKPAEARKEFLAATREDPSLPGPLYNLAIVDRSYFFDDASAREWFRRYRALSADDPDGLAELLDPQVAVKDSAAPEVRP